MTLLGNCGQLRAHGLRGSTYLPSHEALARSLAPEMLFLCVQRDIHKNVYHSIFMITKAKKKMEQQFN
jgi:hypothetical protein